MFSLVQKKTRSVLQTIKWHETHGYRPIQIDVSDPKVSMLVMVNESEESLFPDTAFICFHPLGYEAVKNCLLKLGYDTMFVDAN